MQGSTEDPHDVVHTLENSRLVRAMRLHCRSEDPRAKEMFLYALCESTLIVFTGQAVDDSAARPDRPGYKHYAIGTEIPLALLTDPCTGNSAMPVFTSVEAYRSQSLVQLENCLAMSAIQAMELMLSTNAISFAIDVGSRHNLELARDTVQFLYSAVSGKRETSQASHAMLM